MFFAVRPFRDVTVKTACEKRASTRVYAQSARDYRMTVNPRVLDHGSAAAPLELFVPGSPANGSGLPRKTLAPDTKHRTRWHI